MYMDTIKDEHDIRFGTNKIFDARGHRRGTQSSTPRSSSRMPNTSTSRSEDRSAEARSLSSPRTPRSSTPMCDPFSKPHIFITYNIHLLHINVHACIHMVMVWGHYADSPKLNI